MTQMGTTTDVTGLTNITTVNTNIYNAGGQRIKKTENSQLTKYFYTGSAILYTTNESNTIMTENILDLSGQIAASWRDRGTGGETINFYNYDKRGSTTNIVDPSGNSVKSYTYDEFGNVSATGTFDNEITFTGSVSDSSTGLQYMNARFYNPTTGRFLSQDSYTGDPFDPWTQHLYSYCGNNPTNFIDPTGHMRVEGWGVGDYSYRIPAFDSGDEEDVSEEDDEEEDYATWDGGLPIIIGYTPKVGLPPNEWTQVSDSTWRWADSNGRADYDIDTKGNSKHHKFPHQHDWDWDGIKAKRGGEHEPTRPLPGDEVEPNPEPEVESPSSLDWLEDHGLYPLEEPSGPIIDIGVQDAVLALLAALAFYVSGGSYCPAF